MTHALHHSDPREPAGAEDAQARRLAGIPAMHPRLHFGPEGADELRRRATGTHHRYAQFLFDWVERCREWSPPVEAPDRALNEVVLEECGAFVTNAALAFVVSGREEHRELARRWALAMSEWPRGELRNYGLGLYAAGLARAYDWLYDQWSEAERQRLREHLSGLVRQVYQGSLPEEPGAHWWAGAHLHHDFWVPVGGFGEAALALLGEVEEAGAWAARAKRLFDECFAWLGEDGAWLEGPADWCYALAPLLWFYGAWESVTGEDLHDKPWLRQTARYRLYHWLPDDTYIYLNDSFRSGRYNTSGSAACHLLRRLASRFRDGVAQWLAARDEAFDLQPGPKGVYQAPYEGSSYRAERREYPFPDSQCAAWNLLWYDPTIAPESPSRLPGSRQFENQGVAILRGGWDDEAAVVSLSCGPLGGHRCAARIRAGEARSASNFSHTHADYNSFTLFARGQYLLIPPGYARRGSGFQNTVAVNGADLRVDPSLEVRLLGLAEGPGYGYAAGDATAAFVREAGVARWVRHLVLLEGCLVLFDDLHLASTATRAWNRFQWTLHSDPGTHRLSCEGSTAIWRSHGSDAPVLVLHILEPAEFAWERATLQSPDGTPGTRAAGGLEALRLVRPEWHSDRMQVLAVLTWEEAPTRPSLLATEEWHGVAWPERPAIGFRLAADEPYSAGSPVLQALGDRPFWLFDGRR